jgi:hypothetical protein
MDSTFHGEIDFLVEILTRVYCDNQTTIQVVENPIAQNKMKHVEIHAHYFI